MLKYSCTNSRLVNWVLRQVNDQPGFLFPKRKGWEVKVRLHYPGSQNLVYFNVLVCNESELLVFIPINEKAETSHLKCLTNPKYLRRVKKEINRAARSVQIVFVACEKNEEFVLGKLNERLQNFNLMILNYEGMYFAKGNFRNPRLEYRLSVQELDTDLIPNLLPEPQQVINDGTTNSLFYQNILFQINRCWLMGSSSISLRAALKNSVPYWKQYRKKDQQEIINQIKEDLSEVFGEFYNNKFLVRENAKGNPGAETVIVFPEAPTGRKELNMWSRKQELALDYFRDEGKQVSIDGLQLTLESDIIN